MGRSAGGDEIVRKGLTLVLVAGVTLALSLVGFAFAAGINKPIKVIVGNL